MLPQAKSRVSGAQQRNCLTPTHIRAAEGDSAALAFPGETRVPGCYNGVSDYAERSRMQLIKKYANRKLYHTNRKQYITLEGIAALIQAGEAVQVLDNETGEDITSSILTQVVLQSRASGERLPTNVLTGLIQAGGDTIAGMRRSFWSTLGGASMVDSEISRRL